MGPQDFGDRLINEKDRTWMRNQLGKLLTPDYETKTEDILDTDRWIFGNFPVQGVDVQFYAEIEDLAKMKVKTTTKTPRAVLPRLHGRGAPGVCGAPAPGPLGRLLHAEGGAVSERSMGKNEKRRFFRILCPEASPALWTSGPEIGVAGRRRKKQTNKQTNKQTSMAQAL